ncbi:hypothetical protein BDF21DRAFT_418211 [Thamnidium elegans]|nr:hypothetical protein BDF21DRAFT_418211 [Thamnidium elegans]
MFSILVLIIPSFILSRYAISKKSMLLMTLFILFQLLFIASMVYIARSTEDILTDCSILWFIGFVSLIAATVCTKRMVYNKLRKLI